MNIVKIILIILLIALPLCVAGSRAKTNEELMKDITKYTMAFCMCLVTFITLIMMNGIN